MRRRSLLQGLVALILSPFVARKSPSPYGNLAPGETTIFGPDASFVRCHADGRVTVVTAEEFAAPVSGEPVDFVTARVTTERASNLRDEYISDALGHISSPRRAEPLPKWRGRLSLGKRGAHRALVAHETWCDPATHAPLSCGCGAVRACFDGVPS